MTKEELFDIWAPKESTWSDWAKPVLFAHITPAFDPPVERTESRSANLTMEWLSALRNRSAIVVDLSGRASIEYGLALAHYGYRPVPLFNAIPGPTDLITLSPTETVPVSYVDVNPIIRGLIEGAQELKQVKLTPDAPPAFLLDASRQTGHGAIVDGRFDNRSVLFPTDFPSSNVLKRNSIQQIIVVQGIIEQPKADLAHTLLRWQQSGIAIMAQDLDRVSLPSPMDVRKPSYFRWIWQRVFIAFGLHPNPRGGFGEMVQRSTGG